MGFTNCVPGAEGREERGEKAWAVAEILENLQKAERCVLNPAKLELRGGYCYLFFQIYSLPVSLPKVGGSLAWPLPPDLDFVPERGSFLRGSAHHPALLAPLPPILAGCPTPPYLGRA